MRQRRPAIYAIAEWAAQEGAPLLKPVVLYQEFTVAAITHERLTVNNGRRKFISGQLVGEHLLGASRLIAMLCTIGPDLEETASAVMQEDALRGLALDAAGSAAAEILATHASHYFETQARQQGLQCSMPLNPGMIGWSVPEGQPQLFNLLAEERSLHPELNIGLTESYLMTPRKTVSLALGMGEKLAPAGRICDYCNLNETCRYQNHYP